MNLKMGKDKITKKKGLVQLVIRLKPMEYIYLEIMAELLNQRISYKQNKVFLLELIDLTNQYLDLGHYKEEGILGKFLLSLKVNQKRRRNFKVLLEKEEYEKFWTVGKRLKLTTKREIMIGMLLVCEKGLRHIAKTALIKVNTFLKYNQE